MKYVPRGRIGSSPIDRKPAASWSRLSCRSSRAFSTHSSPSLRSARDGRLERRAGDVAEELFHCGDLVDQLRGERPADLPTSCRERLAGGGDPYRPLSHPREGGQRQVLGGIEGQMLVHLIADDQTSCCTARSAIATRSVRFSTAPVGLCGELINSALVLGVNAAASSA